MKAKQQEIKVKEVMESPTNPRGRDFEDASFRDLVASVKASGVLQPIIVRTMRADAKAKGCKWLLVAGARRLRACLKAGIETVPAMVHDGMTEKEAREVQVVENLQRADVHPMDEARAYEGLVQDVKDFKSVAAKVGKSEEYVRSRMRLVRLGKEAEAAYRSGEMNDGQAAEASRMSPLGDQQKALTYIRERRKYGRELTVKDLRAWIDEEFSTHLGFQPWLKDPKAAQAVGPCKHCPPNRDTLFGSSAEGACTATKCWRIKLNRFIEWKKESNPGMLMVASDYGQREPGVLGIHDFKKVKKGECANAKPAMVGDGKRRGSMITACHGHCQKHNPKAEKLIKDMTPEQKKRHEAKRKAEREDELRKQQEKTAREFKEMEDAMNAISWPPSCAAMEPVFLAVLSECGDLERVAFRNGAVRKEDGMTEDEARQAVRKIYDERGPLERFRLIVEMCADVSWDDAALKAIRSLAKL